MQPHINFNVDSLELNAIQEIQHINLHSYAFYRIESDDESYAIQIRQRL